MGETGIILPKKAISHFAKGLNEHICIIILIKRNVPSEFVKNCLRNFLWEHVFQLSRAIQSRPPVRGLPPCQKFPGTTPVAVFKP